MELVKCCPKPQRHWYRESLYGVPAHRVNTRDSLSFALRKTLFPLSFAQHDNGGYRPVSLVSRCQESPSDRRLAPGLTYGWRFQPCAENQGGGRDEITVNRLCVTTSPQRIVCLRPTAIMEAKIRPCLAPVTLSATAYSIGLQVIHSIKGLLPTGLL